MNVFNSMFGPKKPEKPVFDPTLGDGLAKKILDEAKLGKCNILLNKVAVLRNGQWDKRAFYVDLASEFLINTQFVDEFADDALGNLLRGSIAIHLAWKARGSGMAETVTEDGRVGFFKYLDIAAKCLLRAAEQDKEDPTPLAFLQTVAMGLQLDREVAVSWLNEAVKRDPYNQQAHNRHLYLLTEKWGGSHEEMFTFARATIKKLPPETTLNSILYHAFFERVSYFYGFEKNPEGVREWIRDPSLREEALTHYQKTLQHRKKIEQASDYWPHNLALWWFYLVNNAEVTRQETKKIGPNVTKYPWEIYQDPAGVAYKAMQL
jgi:hypothetical protein